MRRRLSLSAVLLALAWLAARSVRRSRSWGHVDPWQDRRTRAAIDRGLADIRAGRLVPYRPADDSFLCDESDYLPSTYRRRGVL